MRVLGLAIVLIGCSFSPEIGDGTISCGPKGSCPPGFVCGADLRCVLPQPPPPPVDASVDATPIDAAPDACKKHCMDMDCCR